MKILKLLALTVVICIIFSACTHTADTLDSAQQDDTVNSLETNTPNITEPNITEPNITEPDITEPELITPETDENISEDSLCTVVVPENADNYWTMSGYYGKTTNDIINIFGDDYELTDFLIGGGWRGLFFEDNPFLFCYASNDTNGQRCNGNEKILAVMTYNGGKFGDKFTVLFGEELYATVDEIGLSAHSTYQEVSSAVDGEFWVNEMDGGFSYSISCYDNYRITFNWADETSEYPSEVTVVYRYN